MARYHNVIILERRIREIVINAPGRTDGLVSSDQSKLRCLSESDPQFLPEGHLIEDIIFCEDLTWYTRRQLLGHVYQDPEDAGAVPSRLTVD